MSHSPYLLVDDTFATHAIGSGGRSFYLFINVSLVLSGTISPSGAWGSLLRIKDEALRQKRSLPLLSARAQSA